VELKGIKAPFHRVVESSEACKELIKKKRMALPNSTTQLAGYHERKTRLHRTWDTK
jgi:hypothetical protein